MIIVMRANAAKKDIENVLNILKPFPVDFQVIHGKERAVIGLVGDTFAVDKEIIEIQPMVEKILKVQEPFKKANKIFHPNDTIVDISGVKIGGGNFAAIAGPCSVETEDQIVEIAKRVKKSGASLLRGGAFKPRTSPYAFQGLQERGIELLLIAKKESGLPIVSEIMSSKYLDLFEEKVDLVQVGARNMQNFDLLKELGKSKKPVLLKRGMSNTIEEWLMSAEYIMSSGNENVILCERGIRTFETYTRNTFDISAIIAIKTLSHLPIIADPSHAAGRREMVESLALASCSAGTDGIMIEVHNDPQKALCDGPQSITPDDFDTLMRKVTVINEAINSVNLVN